MNHQLDPRELERYVDIPTAQLRRKLQRRARWHRIGCCFENIAGAVTSLATGVLLMGGLVTGLWVIIFH